MTTAKLLQNCFYAMVSTVYTAFKSDQKTLNTYIDCVSLEKVIRKRFDIRGQQHANDDESAEIVYNCANASKLTVLKMSKGTIADFKIRSSISNDMQQNSDFEKRVNGHLSRSCSFLYFFYSMIMN